MEKLVSLYLSTGQNIDSMWEFYIKIHLAIICGIFLFRNNQFKLKHKVTKYDIVILMLCYVLFSLVNARAKINAYDLLYKITLDIQSMKIVNRENIKNFFIYVNYSDRLFLVYFVHIISLIVISYLMVANSKKS